MGSCIGSVMPIIIIMPIIHYTHKLSHQDPGVVLVEVVATVRTVNLGAVVVLQELSDGGSIGLHKPKHLSCSFYVSNVWVFLHLKSGLSSAVQILHRLAPGSEGDGSFNILISALGFEGTLSKNKYIINQNCLDILST